jgi:hypothetical protein
MANQFFKECGHSVRGLDVRNPQLKELLRPMSPLLRREVHHASIFVGKDASADERSRLNNHVP